MLKKFRFLYVLLGTWPHLLWPSLASANALEFFVNAPGAHDYGLQTTLPSTFGTGEFSFELWIRPNASFPVGPTSGNGQLTHWSNADVEPYSSNSWWFEGNFLLDGHNNAAFADGTFSLQFYGGGRVRWLFGDGADSVAGGHWSIGAYPATLVPSLLDGRWHHLTLVRRFTGLSGADLELWIDGSLIAKENTSLRTNMRTWWDGWADFPSGQEGWFWGAEKQAAIGVLTQYEDFKGEIDELRLWSRALTPTEIQGGWYLPVDGSEMGLVGWIVLDEGRGRVACDAFVVTDCIDLFDMKTGHWRLNGAPIEGVFFRDGFENGAASFWSRQFP